MKFYKLILIILILTGYEQSAQATLLTQVTWNDLITNSTYIFEGTVTAKTYFTGSDGNIYTNNTVLINKQMQGSLNCGSVEVVTLGGDNGTFMQTAVGALSLDSGSTAIFMCNATGYPTMSPPGDNPTILEVYADIQGVVKYDMSDSIGDTLYHWYWYDLPDINNLYQILFANNGYYYSSCMYKKAEHHKTDEVAGFYPVSFKVGPLHPTSVGGHDSVEFDIIVEDSITTQDRYLNDGVFTINTNLNIFNSGIANYVKYSFPSAAALNFDEYTMSFTAPPPPNDNQIIVNYTCHISGNRIAVHSTPHVFFHVKIPVFNCITEAGQIYTLNTGSASFGQGNGPSCFDHSSDVEGDYFIIGDQTQSKKKACVPDPPQITGLSIHSGSLPSGIFAGGVEQLMDISGHNFGTNKGQVLFPEATTGATALPIDPTQLITWDTNLIVIMVPSNLNGNSGSMAVSGEMFIKKPTAETDTFPVQIAYSVRNKYINGGSRSFYTANMRNSDSTGGYTFYLNNNMNGNWQNKACFRDAIRLWVCNTQVGFIMADSYTSNSHFGGHATTHQQNTVSFATMPQGTLSRTWINSPSPCSYNTGGPKNEFHNYMSSFDIEISSALAGLIYPSPAHLYGSFANKYDMESIMMHELGHCMGLNETTNGGSFGTDDIMKINLAFGEVRSLQTNEITGGTNQVDSAALTWTCNTKGAMSKITSCESTGIANILNSNYKIAATPNPFGNSIVIDYDGPAETPVNLIITDMEGKTVYTDPEYAFGKKPIELGFLKPGIYMLKTNNKYGTYTIKINKQ